MQCAIYLNKTIHLENINREKYQSIYVAGKKGELICPGCGENVRLYLGIENQPAFFHVLNQAKKCTNLPNVLEKISPNREEAFIERNGFRIPVSRSIGSAVTATHERSRIFKQAQPINVKQPFVVSPAYTGELTYQYLLELESKGFNLDRSQAEAVRHTEGPLLVLAGAGSGKTRVLTARTAFMLEEKRVDPQTMLLVTFTAKAASEMKQRLTNYPKITEKQVQQLVTGTFHSIFYRILSYHNRQKWNSTNLLKRDWQREQILKEAGRSLNLNEKDFSYDLALQKISYWKNHLEDPKTVKPTDNWEENVAYLYQQYEKTKQNQQLFDFDDMLIGCFHLFKEKPDLLETYQNRFQYFLIDEFQDVNKVQYELIKLLSAKSKNICAVGDDDQSIYAFRGSDPTYLLQFEQDFPQAQLVVLNQNYRSSHEIVSTANRIIAQNKQRRQKKMNAQYKSNKSPVFFYPYDEEEEATMILTDIQEKIGRGKTPGEFAVLFRTNTGSRAIFERLVHSSLPFKIDQDIESFYERFIVKGMLSFLKLSVDEDDLQSIKAILPSLFVKQSILQDIKAMSILQDCSLLEALSKQKTAFAFQTKKLQKLVPVIRGLSALSPVLAIERVEKELGFQDFVKKRGNEGNMLEKGSDDLRDLKVAAKSFSSIRDFLDHTDHMKAMNKEMKQVSKRLQDAITLSTIHRAKGLEYNTVYVLGAVDGTLPHDYALDSLRNGDSSPLEEERRLMYVAVTRAKEELYISVPERSRGKKAHSSRFIKTIK